MKCRHMTCYQCEDAELVSLREEYEIMREDSERLRRERDEARACLAFERVTVAELRAEVEFIKAEYEKANASDLTRDALALQNATLLHKAENYNGLVDALKVSEDENKKLIAALNKARADAIMLRSALNKYFKPSLPYAQWSNEEHQVEIVLDKTEQYK